MRKQKSWADKEVKCHMEGKSAGDKEKRGERKTKWDIKKSNKQGGQTK